MAEQPLLAIEPYNLGRVKPPRHRLYALDPVERMLTAKQFISDTSEGILISFFADRAVKLFGSHVGEDLVGIGKSILVSDREDSSNAKVG